jgi:acetoin:2,6-dichlorophenolindophenol oxidoreductase subunit alpha
MGGTGEGARPAGDAARRARLTALYATMLRIRAFEDAAEEASRGGVAVFGQQASAKPAAVRGPLHLSTGQEAVAAGVCANLARADYLTSTHRGHGHTIAKGADVGRMMLELFGRAGGSCGGRGGSMHIADFGVGMLGANGVVAAGLPIAVGAAHSVRIRRAPEVVACFFGDGAINRGPFGEALNWAQVYRLPVLFVCEDNRWSATTPTGALTAGDGAAARARAYGIEARAVDGNDVEAVDAVAAELADAVRAGHGPRFLHAITYRVKGHVSVDPAAYRDPAELEAARGNDPLLRARALLASLGAGEAELAEIEAAARDEIAAAVSLAAKAAPAPAASAYSEIQDCGAGRWRS